MDIIGRIDDTIEDWERRPDAARWTPDGGQHSTEGRGLTLSWDGPAVTQGETRAFWRLADSDEWHPLASVGVAAPGQVFFAPAGTDVQDVVGDVLNERNGWSAVGTVSTPTSLRAFEIANDDDGARFTLRAPEHPLVHAGWCLECTDGEQGVELFATAEDRAEWMDVHKACTDHDRWRLLSFRDTTIRA